MATFLPCAEVSQKGKGKHHGCKGLGGIEGDCNISCLIHAPVLWSFSFFLCFFFLVVVFKIQRTYHRRSFKKFPKEPWMAKKPERQHLLLCIKPSGGY